MTAKTEARPMPSKAMVLAAGLGTRLRPLTERTPKCMIPLAGKPLLEHTVAWLKRFGVSDLLVNVHALPEVIIGHFGNGSRFGASITYSVEAELRGTAGAVRDADWFFDGPFFVWYGDNFSTCRLDRLWRLHVERGGVGTIALHYRDDPADSGIVGVDEESGRVTRFLEKPRRDRIFSHWVSTGIFALEREVMAGVGPGAPDFGRDVFPAMIAQGRALYGYRLANDELFGWIDRPEDLARLRARLDSAG